MKINFLLSNNYNIPVGGYKVVFEYANMFANAGDDVTITFMIYDKTPLSYRGRTKNFLSKSKRKFFFKMGIIYTSKKTVSWFKLDKKIKINFALPDNKYFPDADVAVATAWQTAYTLNNLSTRKGKKFYLIQHDERIFAEDKMVRPTWSFQMQKIVVASWLKDLLKEEAGQKSFLVKNFVDTKSFYREKPISTRDHTISMLNHKNIFKGTQDGIKALERVYQVVPDIHVKLFGTPPAPLNLPEYIEYKQNARSDELRDIYNSSSLYVLPSYLEGWGLTATEAMSCGATLVSTRNGGVDDFGLNKKTALLSEPGDIASLANNIILLLENDMLRCRLAEAGEKLVRDLTIGKSFDKLSKIFEKSLLKGQI
ncbi:glycosyltransferase family 4 protein [Oenococcus oeni]|uniref:glycosyltransferase family 4 protein n=1 Tax=Oenococcus oeni TaxID=1247 RepID=UPI0005102C75|nr:glycosyltransferase family 4 protein [Oenococcus oeni]KGI02462.1 polysaccharide biosynthesis protein [Oenococcus oeni IOEB_C52]PDH96226.1 polysaccharide biosynthesis protein [Oenococcus oeni]SYW08482.1 Polysaccharide biosynthesis protein [Oenococcus oeni]